MIMPVSFFKFGFAILFALNTIYACYIIITKQILVALRTGQWRARTGVADRVQSPKTFWLFFSIGCLIVAGGVVASVALLISFIPFSDIPT